MAIKVSGTTVIDDSRSLTNVASIDSASSNSLKSQMGAAAYDQAPSSTGAFAFSSGTTAQRPSSPSVGMMRYNPTESSFEVYTGSAWFMLNTTAY